MYGRPLPLNSCVIASLPYRSSVAASAGVPWNWRMKRLTKQLMGTRQIDFSRYIRKSNTNRIPAFQGLSFSHTGPVGRPKTI